MSEIEELEAELKELKEATAIEDRKAELIEEIGKHKWKMKQIDHDRKTSTKFFKFMKEWGNNLAKK